jgi:hypothetical protein
MSELSRFRQGGITFKGAYVAETTYYPNQTVTYANSVYICLAQTTGNIPTTQAYWSLLTAPPDISVATSGAGTTPASFTLTSSGSAITLNKPS